MELGDWTAASGYRIGKALATRPEVTAVFAANDHMALGLMLALREAGRRVPEDVSVVGFDDVPESAYFAPPLSTVRQDFEEVGRQCVELLLDQVDSPPGERPAARLISVTPELVVRSSSAPPSARLRA
ncbi:substrate-binding domain-containing protein [Kitasatospora sp. Root107]|uniref:substrate-binding domain-containing protein n=1 Tax=Kitasatospora sp. Root107 TaxID=1736424 RepID=UPI003515632A